MKVKDLMTADVACCKETESAEQAAKLMKQHDCGSIPVCDNSSHVLGMVTDRDLVIHVLAEGRSRATVKDCMTHQVVKCREDADAHEAADLMAQFQIRRLPVVDANDKLCGIVAIADLATENIHINEAGDALSKISTATASENAIH